MRYPVTSELEPDLFDEFERERQSAGLSRAAGMREALRFWLRYRKEQGEEYISKNGEVKSKVEDSRDYLEELVRTQADRLAKMIYRDHRATEALTEIVTTQFGDRLALEPEQARGIAAQRINDEAKAERARKREARK